MPKPLTIGLIAGEASGDLLGAELIAAIREQRPDARFVGVAGPQMEEAGCEAWWPSDTLSVMGLVEVLSHLPRLLKFRRALVQRLADEKLDVLIGIDSPDFNLGVEKRLRRKGVKTVQYVSPSVWAWRENRVKTVRDAADLVLCLLPFEPKFYEEHGVAAEFVGHPLADEIPMEWDRDASRQRLGLATDAELLAVLPGSRSGEIKRLAPPFAECMKWLQQRRPSLKFVIPLARDTHRSIVLEAVEAADVRPAPVIVTGQSRQVMGAADAVICASGTAALESALIKRPTVVAYRLSPLTVALVRLFNLVKVNSVALPNLLAPAPVFPELIQEAVTGSALGEAVLEGLTAAGQESPWYDACVGIHQQLAIGSSRRAAAAVLECL